MCFYLSYLQESHMLGMSLGTLWLVIGPVDEQRTITAPLCTSRLCIKQQLTIMPPFLIKIIRGLFSQTNKDFR